MVNDPSPTDCPVSAAAAANPAANSGCAPATCRWRCALEVVDELLRLPRKAVSGEEVDLLLDLRGQLRRRTEAEAALRLFCDLRRRMENHHYLAFFRIRRWLENHLVATVRVCPAVDVRLVPVRLDHPCVEAIRRVCLCASLGRGTVRLVPPRLEFWFRSLVPSAGSLAGRPSPGFAGKTGPVG